MKKVNTVVIGSTLFMAISANAFEFKVANHTGHDIQTIVLYNNGLSKSGDECIAPTGEIKNMVLFAEPETYGKISSAFIKRYSSNDGSCTMQSSRVGYSNIVSFDANDLNSNSPNVHYFSFTSTGLNMTPVVIFNPQIKTVTMYTGYRQGDKGQGSYAYFKDTPKDELDSLSLPDVDNAYSSRAYITSGQSLYLY